MLLGFHTLFMYFLKKKQLYSELKKIQVNKAGDFKP